MREIKYVLFILLIFMIFSMLVSCGMLKEIEISTDSEYNIYFSESVETIEVTTNDESVEFTEMSENSVSGTTVNDSNEYTESQIVEAILIDNDFYGFYSQISVSDSVDYMIAAVEALSNRSYGQITSKEDAKNIARTILIDKGEIDYVKRVEIDFVDVNGERMSYQRKNEPYTITYYEDYDVWLIIPHLPSGIREDGVTFDTPSSDRYIMIRGTDGKVLAIF